MPDHDDRMPPVSQLKPGLFQRLRSLFSGKSQAAPTPPEKISAAEPVPVASGSESDRDAMRERQNEWIKERYKEWQFAWHDIFDQDRTLQAKGDFERPDPLPDDIDSDYRLIFGLFHAEQETRRRCFAMLANGEEMHRRFDAFVTGTRQQLSEQEARQLVSDLGKAVDAASPDEQVDWSRVTIVNRDDADALDNLSECDRIEVLFSENLLEPTPEKELSALAAQLFLTEPLYAAAGNFYELRDWVTGIGFDPRRDRAFELIYKVWDGGWQPLVSEDGVILAFGHR
ncbi:hypothetical protein ACRQ1B_00985 [Rhizobium panacihumi]|uniref:hypothetical protein n=1 Tax=Rhizobium panacihumi TaxID=2008450 RepID=UPI003D7B4166